MNGEALGSMEGGQTNEAVANHFNVRVGTVKPIGKISIITIHLGKRDAESKGPLTF
jgi:hypothetical protein